MIVLTLTTLFLIIHQGQCAMTATATLYADGTNTSYGNLTFTQSNTNSFVKITGSVTNLNISSAHGFHVHVYSVSTTFPNCTAAGGHFNPYNTTHGPRTANISSRHVGDLGNITTNGNGTAAIYIEDSIIQLYDGTQSIINRTIIIHRMRDDGGLGGASDSNTTGNAGSRVLCGRIVSNGFVVRPDAFAHYVAMIIALLYVVLP